MNDRPEALFEAAPTLDALKKLPMEQKMRLLFARLKEIGQYSDSALSKHNLTMAADFHQLAYGYPDNENLAIREYLMLTPWAKLVAEGYLGDPRGQGFYKVTEDGLDYLNQKNELPPAAEETPKNPGILPDRIPDVPRVFISYSWDSTAHQEWVLELAKHLQGESGVQIIFDGWHLKLGQDKQRFMEQAIATSDFVVIVCTEKYAQRANDRDGGVGYETGPITSSMADDLSTNKFIPTLRQGTFKTSLPLYLKGRMGVDLRDNPYKKEEYDKLILELHGETVDQPPIGKKPDFSKKKEPELKVKTLLQAIGESIAQQNAGTLLGPLKERPQAEFHTQYDKPGTPGPWIYALIRQWKISGEIKYSLETSQGDEFLGTKDDVIETFSKFNRKLLKDGYKRMQFMPGVDPEFQSL